MTFKEIENIANNRENFKELAGLCMGDLVVPYIGAGLSFFAGFPLWGSCLVKFIEKYCNDKTISTENLYDAADAIMEDLKSEKFNEVFFDTFGGNLNDDDWNIILEKAKDEAVYIVSKLFKTPIITTNFDQILEKIHKPTLPVAYPNHINHIEETKNAIKHRKRLIYKIHGCVSNPNDVVFTGKSYKKAYRSNSELVQKLSDFFKGVSFLFLGCGLDLSKSGKDKPIELWEKLTKTQMYHFAILEYPDDLKKRQDELEKRNIKPIFFPKSRFDTIKIILDEILDRKKSVFGKIPEYKSDFIGRKNILNEIEQHLGNSDYSAFALTGTGGVGKTRIMREYANEKQKAQAYKQIIWFNAVSKDSVQAGIYQFAVKERLIDEKTTKTPQEIFDEVKKWMIGKDNWLFLLDNVEYYNDIEDLLSIKSDITTKSKRHFLITTRKSELPIKHRAVDVFTENESQDFFHSYTGLEPNDFSKKVAVELGFLPLALEQAAAYIKNNKEKRITYQNYFNKLKKSLAILKEGNSEGRTLSVEATWNISMRMIDNDESRQLLNLCSFFAPDNINCSWFREASERLNLLSLPEKIRNEEEYKKILSELAEYSLIRIENDKISIHRLTQDAIRNSIPAKNKKNLIDICVKIMEKFVFLDFDTAKSRNNFREMTLHIEKLFGICKKETTEIARLYHFWMYGFDRLKNYTEALKYEDKTLKIRKNVLGLYNKDTGSTYNVLGVIYLNMGRYDKSLPYLLEALSIRKEVFRKSNTEENDINIARSYNNIAILHYYKGKYVIASNYYKKALKIKEKYKDYKDTAFTYNNIAALYDVISQDDNNKAMYYNRKALSIREREYEKENVNVAFTYNNIGVIYKNQGNYHDALFFLEEALKIREKVYEYEQDHPEIAQTCTNLADIYINKENYVKAWNLLQRAIEIYEKKLPDNIDAAKAYYNMAKYYYNQNDYGNALDWFIKVLRIREKVLSKKHSSTQEVKAIMEMAYNRTNNSIPFEKWLKEKKK